MKKMKYVLGIDLGTTNCCISYYADGKSHIIEDGPNATIESLVAYKTQHDGTLEKYIGSSARSRFHELDVIYCIKRLIGYTYSKYSELVKSGTIKKPNYKIEQGPNDTIQIRVSDKKTFTPIEISSHILAHLKKIAEKKLGVEITEAVITVPAHFNDEQRSATKTAGEIAGLKVERIINEPTAAALAYGVNKTAADVMNVLIYDFGGGTFDVSILSIHNNGIIEVQATAGDLLLGGSDVNDKLYEHFRKKIQSSLAFDVNDNARNKFLLYDAVENLKKELSSNDNCERSVVLFKSNNICDFTLSMRRAEFDSLIKNIIDKTLRICDDVIISASKKDSGFSRSKIDKVLLVGGSTRIVAVREALANIFGKSKIDSTLNPDQVVAVGAAIQGSILLGTDDTVNDILLLDVIPLSLGIETKGGIMAKIVEANTTIPTKKSQVFTTAEDNQTTVSIVVFQGERPECVNNKQLGKFDLTGIQPASSGVPQIEVTFDIDANGILNVSAKDKASGKQCQVSITTKGTMTDDEIKRAKEEAEKYKAEDEKKMALITAQNECESLINSVKDSIEKDKDKLDADLISSANTGIEEAKKAVESKDLDSISSAKQKLTDIANKIYEALSKSSSNSDTNTNTNTNRGEYSAEEKDASAEEGPETAAA